MPLLSVTPCLGSLNLLNYILEDNGESEFHRAVSTINQLWVASWGRSCLGKSINFVVFDLKCVMYHVACSHWSGGS